MPRAAGLAVSALLCTLAACSQPQVACTQIAAQAGVSVTVAKEAAAGLTRLTLNVCVDDRCRDLPVQLAPGADTIDEGCDETAGPDGVCSATAVPNGTLVGFVEVADLPAGPVTVRAVATRGQRTVRLGPATIEAATVYPNGRDCPGEANQANVTVGLDRLS